jgi:hypothetical protein
MNRDALTWSKVNLAYSTHENARCRLGCRLVISQSAKHMILIDDGNPILKQNIPTRQEFTL